MEALGEAFDCAANRVNLGLDQFFEMFVATGVADAFGAGAPRYVSGSSGIELVLDVCYRAGLDIGVPLADMASDGEGPDYWCGWVLAYWQWETGRPFRTIGRVTTMEEIRALYWPLHEAAEQKFVEVIEERVARDKYMNASELQSILRGEIATLMEDAHGSSENFGLDATEGQPYVVMVVGVNGAGKTTTIGKLAAQLGKAGRKVWIGAADTFRAAAIDQLQVWADRAGATMIRQQMGSDPASVAFDTLTSAKANGADVVLIDTAGRLHNKVGLMNELTKIRNVMGKVIPGAPHEVMLVLDGSTGQNAFEQAKQFTQATQVTSLTITKLDGTAKGGVVIGISDQFHIPVRYIGIGEGIDQLRIFDRKEFVNALFGHEKN